VAVLGVAATLTAALTQSATSAAFMATTGDAGNQVTTAATFCTSPDSVTLSPTSDAAVYQSQPATRYGSSPSMGVGVGTTTTANAHTFITFSLATQAPLPARCRVTSATLNVHATTPMTGATIHAYRADAAWNAATLTWGTGRPGFTGTPAGTTSLTTGSSGWQRWDVTALTRELYAGPDYGFALRDAANSAASARYQTWDSMDSTTVLNRPTLEITWG
jgi:hypothetical protein